MSDIVSIDRREVAADEEAVIVQVDGRDLGACVRFPALIHRTVGQVHESQAVAPGLVAIAVGDADETPANDHRGVVWPVFDGQDFIIELWSE